MSDISETNNPRFCSFIFTKSHLQDCGLGCNKRLLSVVVITDTVDTITYLCLYNNAVKCHTAFERILKKRKRDEMLKHKIGSIQKGKLCPTAFGL